MERNLGKNRVFQERTNTPANPVCSTLKPSVTFETPMAAVDILDGSLTPYEIPSPAILSEPRALTNVERKVKRLARYSTAENALAETLKRSQFETPPIQLQIDAISRAASLLNDRAAEAAEEAQRLRTLLAGHDLENRTYRTSQQQRWLLERRRVAADDLVRTLQQHISTLKLGLPLDRNRTMPTVTPASRATLNLAQFLKSPQHSTPARRRMSSRRAPRKEKVDEKYMTPAVHRHNRLQPLLLPTHLTKAKRTRLKPTPILHHRRPPSTTITSSLSQVPEQVPTVSASHLERVRHPSLRSVFDGTAMIWRDNLRTREEILAEFESHSNINMPAYFAGLLAELDSTTLPESTVSSLQVPKTPITQSPPMKLRSSASKTTFKEPSVKPEKTSPSKLRKSPSLRRLSAMISLPDALSSRYKADDSNSLPKRNFAQKSSSWRMSSPPTSFPSSMQREPTVGLGSGDLPSTVTDSSRLSLPQTRPFSISFSDLPLTSRSSASSPLPEIRPAAVSVTNLVSTSSQTTTPDSQAQSTESRGNMLHRLRRKMSALKRL